MVNNMTKYRKKPVEIEAELWDGTNESKIMEWCSNSYYEKVAVSASRYNTEYEPSLFIETLEGIMRASVGDYIIRGVKGEFYPCKPDIFAATYEEV
jgi:hypothetical protein